MPEAAIGAQQGSRYVLGADPEGRLTQRPVTLGIRFGAGRVVTAGVEPGENIVIAGLEPGENIVIAGLQFLRPGPAGWPPRHAR